MGRPYVCDGPGCDSWVRTREGFKRHGGWIVVHDSATARCDCVEKKDTLLFCSWDCVLQHGMANTQRVETV